MGVILYSTGCPKCNILKRKLAEKSIDYIESNDVEKMISLGITTVPVLSIDEELLDFKPAVEWVNRQ